MSAILKIQNVTKNFDGLIVVRDCNIELETSVISGLIGPNGAGKSTLFNIVAGVYPPDRGSVRLNDVDVTGLPAYQVSRLGLLRTFQIPREFSNMSTIENLLMVPPLQTGERLLNALFRLGAFRADENKNRKKPWRYWISLGCLTSEMSWLEICLEAKRSYWNWVELSWWMRKSCYWTSWELESTTHCSIDWRTKSFDSTKRWARLSSLFEKLLGVDYYRMINSP